MIDFQKMRDQILGLMESLEELQASSDPVQGYEMLKEHIERLKKHVFDRLDSIEVLHADINARIEAMEANIMGKLDQLGPFWYPVTTTWPQKDTTPPYQPWQPKYDLPYRIICDSGQTGGITSGSNSAGYVSLEELGTLDEPLRGLQYAEHCMRQGSRGGGVDAVSNALPQARKPV